MPWGLVIVGLILFWPLGLFLLFRKIRTDKTATLRNGKLVAGISYVLLFFGFVYISLTITDGIGYIVPAILTAGGGIWLNRISRGMKTTGERYKKYISLVANQEQTSLDRISSATGIPYDTVVQDLQTMITLGYFHNAHIDRAAREIVLQAPPAPVHAAPARVVTCRSCGANNKLFAPTGICEYCDSPLS